MELVIGGELFHKINKGQYTERDASVIVGKICSALQYLHSMNIAHRDLKPENILLAVAGGTEVKICDFGLSKIHGKEVVMNTLCGTIYYVAPEVLRANNMKGYDLEVDMWSLGVVAYFVLCGFPPFLNQSYAKVIDLITKAEYEFPGNIWADISEEAKDFIRKILIIDPRKRLTATEALQHTWIKNGGLDKVLNFNCEQAKQYSTQHILELQQKQDLF